MRNGTSLGVLALVSAAAAAASAQDTARKGASAADALDEIVVTARKVEERLLEVPLTITAYSSQDLVEAGATGLRDLAVSTPGLFVSSALGSRSSDRIAIRGISAVAGTAGFAGIFIDGVYVPSSFAQGLEVSNVERVEVLKGPQSALFGRATLSGAINYVTKRPGDRWEGFASASLGGQDYSEIAGLISGPVSETVSVLGGARVYSRESDYVNQLSGQRDLGGQSSKNLTAALRWQPSDGFEAYARVLYAKDDDEAGVVYHQNSLANNCLPQSVAQGMATVVIPTYYCGEVVPNTGAIRTVTANSQVPAPFRGTYADDGTAGLDRESVRAMLELDWNFGDFDLTSISALGRDKVRDANDLTTRAAFAYGPSVGLPSITFDRDVKFEDWSQELRLAYAAGGAFSGLVGLYYYDNDRTEFLSYRAGTPAADNGTRSEKNTAVFGRLQWDPTAALSIAAEVRWQKDEIALVNNSSTPRINLDVETTSTLPRLTIDYQLSESLMLYGVASKGTKPATINTAPELVACPERQKTEEEEALNYELGLKGRFFERRLTLQAAVFSIDWDKQEYAGVLQPRECGGVNPAIIRLQVNGGETDVRGIEIEAGAVLIQDWLDVRATYSINDTQIKIGRATSAGEATEGVLAYGTSGFTPICSAGAGVASTLCPPSTPILQGGLFTGLDTSFPAQAEYLFSFSATLGHAIGDGGLSWFLRGDYASASKQYESIFNLNYVGPREGVNLRAGLRSDNFELSVWGRNLTNDGTPTTLLRSISFADDDGATGPRTANSRGYSLYLPETRLYGVTLRYSF